MAGLAPGSARDDAALAASVVEQAATLAAAERRSGLATSQKTSVSDVVTNADHAAEALVTRLLADARPDDGLLGEEGASHPSASGRTWVVDPVDGTRHFVAGSPDHATMLAELRHGRTVRSWIWQPQHSRAYVAEHGAGAWADGVRIEPATDPRTLRPTGTCCGVDYPRLAVGQAGWAAYVKKKPWDHLPGGLLLAEAGGRVVRRAGVLLALSPSASRRA